MNKAAKTFLCSLFIDTCFILGTLGVESLSVKEDVHHLHSDLGLYFLIRSSFQLSP